MIDPINISQLDNVSKCQYLPQEMNPFLTVSESNLMSTTKCLEFSNDLMSQIKVVSVLLAISLIYILVLHIRLMRIRE